MFAGYNSTDLSLTGFFNNQPLGDFVCIDTDVRDYILSNQANHLVYFQDVVPGQYITKENILFKNSTIIDIATEKKALKQQVAKLQTTVTALTQQVLSLTLGSVNNANTK